MIIEVTESVYKGILIERVKDKGWKCNLGGTEYLFPYYTAAEAAIDEIYADIKPVVTKNKGTKLKKLPKDASNDYVMNKQLSALSAELMQLEYENASLTLKHLNNLADALISKDYAEAEHITSVLLQAAEADVNFYKGEQA